LKLALDMADVWTESYKLNSLSEFKTWSSVEDGRFTRFLKVMASTRNDVMKQCGGVEFDYFISKGEPSYVDYTFFNIIVLIEFMFGTHFNVKEYFNTIGVSELYETYEKLVSRPGMIEFLKQEKVPVLYPAKHSENLP